MANTSSLKIPMKCPVALVVGGYVALVPGDAEGKVGPLEDEDRELRVLGRVVEGDVEVLVALAGVGEFHVGGRPFEAFAAFDGRGRL
jgi:hypothetical protein